MRKNTWMFTISNAETKRHLNTLCFYGVDSEEAHTNCIEWADRQYGFDCEASLLEGEIEKNESRRAQSTIEEEYQNEKDIFINIMRVKKIKTVREIV